jgi:FMN phosphatase YigB (HAD superfamily)
LTPAAAGEIVRSMQRLALFDLDDTLVDRHATFRLWAEEFVADHGLDDKALTWLIFADAHSSGPKDRFFTTVRDEFNLAEPADQLWAQYRRRMPDLAFCQTEDLDALGRLSSAGWRIGIVTNGMLDNQLGKIQRTGLAALVDAWCISDEVGIRKPDPEIFRIVAHRCGTSADHGGWMTGDDLTLDIAGGHAAGLQTIWLQPNKGPWSFVAATPDFIVDSVSDAVELLLQSH